MRPTEFAWMKTTGCFPLPAATGTCHSRMYCQKSAASFFESKRLWHQIRPPDKKLWVLSLFAYAECKEHRAKHQSTLLAASPSQSLYPTVPSLGGHNAAVSAKAPNLAAAPAVSVLLLTFAIGTHPSTAAMPAKTTQDSREESISADDTPERQGMRKGTPWPCRATCFGSTLSRKLYTT